jgi:hypothetical protein
MFYYSKNQIFSQPEGGYEGAITVEWLKLDASDFARYHSAIFALLL